VFPWPARHSSTFGVMNGRVGMLIEKHVAASSRLRTLKTVLERWIDVNKDIASRWDWTDCPWWCNEQASVSTFAGAIWRAGGYALEDYSEEKTYRRSHYQGRCDLYFMLRAEDFVLEAKQCWPCVTPRRERPSETLERHLVEACTDVRRVTAKGTIRIGAVIAVPYAATTKATTLRASLSSWLDDAANIRHQAAAWTFPRKAWSLQARDGYYYPGVAIFLRLA
jgi:hypothetical protein